MTTTPAICCCAWTGPLSTVASCPSCGKGPTNRLNPMRIAAMRAVAANSEAPINQSVRHWLIDHKLITPAGKRPPGRDSRIRRPKRPHLVTPAGQLVLDADLVVEQTRHDVAGSVARHAELEQRIIDAMPRVGASHQPADGWQDEVLRRIK